MNEFLSKLGNFLDVTRNKGADAADRAADAFAALADYLRTLGQGVAFQATQADQADQTDIDDCITKCKDAMANAQQPGVAGAAGGWLMLIQVILPVVLELLEKLKERQQNP